MVRKGQVLYRIDPKPLQATLANAQADLATAEVALRQDAERREAPEAARGQQQAVSQQELDNAVADRERRHGAGGGAQSASVESARLDLGYTTVTSPIDGLVGTTLVKAGNLVGRGESTLLTTVSEIDPILFRAGISEAEYLRIARRTAEAGRRAAASRCPSTWCWPTARSIRRRAASTRSSGPSTQRRARSRCSSGSRTRAAIRPGQYGRARCRHRDQEERAARAAAGRAGTAEPVQRRRRRRDNKLAMKTVTVGPRGSRASG